MNCKKTEHTGCYKKVYTIVKIYNGYSRTCMLFNTKAEAFKTMKEYGFKYNKKQGYWYNKNYLFEYRFGNYITINEFYE